MGIFGFLKRTIFTGGKNRQQISWANKLAKARKMGAKVGDGTRFNCDLSALGTEPYLIEIGKNCLFAEGVRFITHDGGVKVLNSLDYFNGKKMDRIATIKIGNNVYAGFDALIMQGVTIGDNVIIGARAVVTHDVPSNSVVAGIPAKVIKTLDEYYRSGVDKGWYYPTGNLSGEAKRAFFEDRFSDK